MGIFGSRNFFLKPPGFFPVEFSTTGNFFLSIFDSGNFQWGFSAAGIFFPSLQDFSPVWLLTLGNFFFRKNSTPEIFLWGFSAAGIFSLASRIFPGRISHNRKIFRDNFWLEEFIKFKYLSTDNMIADMPTKPVCREKHVKFPKAFWKFLAQGIFWLRGFLVRIFGSRNFFPSLQDFSGWDFPLQKFFLRQILTPGIFFKNYFPPEVFSRNFWLQEFFMKIFGNRNFSWISLFHFISFA